MTAEPGATDAELVAGVLSADRDAFAAVYDRYGGKLYDFAYSMLRHPEDAADAVADSFVIVAERLHQLRDPDRLRPWLYAIVRSECLRKLRARKRIAYGGDEQLIEMADDSLTPDQEAEQAAVQKIVWDAAEGLADRDRALLDLHLRQGLEGAELGEAMGVTAANAYVMLNRLRAQVDRSLGAMLIARLGRDDCADLGNLLADWDGAYSPLIRKRVARHIDDCVVCSDRRKKIVSPWMALAAVPAFIAPVGLRQRVVNDTQLVAYTTAKGDSLGVASTVARRSPRAAIAAVAAAVVIAVSGVTALLWPGDGNDATQQAGPLSSASPNTPTSAPTSAAPTANGPTAGKPGSLTVSTTSISLGRTGSTSSVTLTNSGSESVTYQTSSGASWLGTTPTTGAVDAGAASRLTVTADRRAIREGRTSSAITITWPDGSAVVNVTLDEERAPTVGRPTAPSNPSCSVPVRAAVSDESGLSKVVLRWSGPTGSHSVTMSRSGSRWAAEMGEFPIGGPVTMRVVATDDRGNTATGPSTTIQVNPCPQ